MALQIQIPSHSGVTGNYLRITKINSVDLRNKKAEVVLSLFVDKKSSDEGKSPLLSKAYTVDIADVNGNIREQAYPKLKAQPTEEEKKKYSVAPGKGKFHGVSLEKAKDV